jgi:hypothetical protein
MSDCECLEGFAGAAKHDCAQLDSIPKVGKLLKIFTFNY